MAKTVIIRDVWHHNLVSEFDIIRSLSHRYSFVSFDTEFPGVVVSPNIGKDIRCTFTPQQNYALMRANVEAVKIVQLGLTLSDPVGNLPDLDSPQHAYIWQFNFRDFDVDCDFQNADSIALLKRQGIDFVRNKQEGVDSRDFAAQLLQSGMVSWGSRLTWVTFHSSYDFGFLIKMLMGVWGWRLPLNLTDFLGLMRHFFGAAVYDVKHMMGYFDGLYGGLEAVAKTLKVERLAGKSHQAGSDSLLIMQTFLQMCRVYFRQISWGNFNCRLYGFQC